MKKLVPCCPYGHERLELRMVVDVPFVVEFNEEEGDTFCQGNVADPHGDVQYDLDNVGVSSGVFCHDCEEWYSEDAVEEATVVRGKLCSSPTST